MWQSPHSSGLPTQSGLGSSTGIFLSLLPFQLWPVDSPKLLPDQLANGCRKQWLTLMGVCLLTPGWYFFYHDSRLESFWRTPLAAPSYLYPPSNALWRGSFQLVTGAKDTRNVSLNWTFGRKNLGVRGIHEIQHFYFHLILELKCIKWQNACFGS